MALYGLLCQTKKNNSQSYKTQQISNIYIHIFILSGGNLMTPL